MEDKEAEPARCCKWRTLSVLLADSMRHFGQRGGGACFLTSDLCLSLPRLFARQRAYQIPPNVCRSDSSLALDSASTAGGKRDGQHDFIRIEYQVIQLLNPQGITADGKKCSHGFSSTCNPKITVLLDT